MRLGTMCRLSERERERERDRERETESRKAPNTINIKKIENSVTYA